ncbi:MAG: cystathionine gamma-synthase [Gammaproteobacteria bacterium]
MTYKFSTKAIHAGVKPDMATGAVMTPIYQTTTYAQKAPGEPIAGYEYSRTDNPTRHVLEENIAALEEGVGAAAFSSGCAALCAVVHLLKQGDHVLLSDDVYGGTYRIFNQIFAQFGVEFTQVDMTDLSAVKIAIRPNTRLLWCETPTNPMLKILDIPGLKQTISNQSSDVLLAVDNTFATPYLQQPLLLGADIVSHSSTKYLGGHSDVLGGVLIVKNNDLLQKIKFIQNAVGAVPSPMDCFLLLRSLKTLAIRMKQHAENASAIAEFLEAHSAVEKVYYPGLKTHAQHKLAATQMRSFGGMMSVILKTDLQGVKSFIRHLKLFTLAESLGGVESLIEHPAIMTHATIPPQQRLALGIVDGLVRISVGIEDSQDLIEDLRQALNVFKIMG